MKIVSVLGSKPYDLTELFNLMKYASVKDFDGFLSAYFSENSYPKLLMSLKVHQPVKNCIKDK